MGQNKENVKQFVHRKVNEWLGWLRSPETSKAFSNAGAILGSSEYPRYGTETDNRYNEAINEKDPEVKKRQNEILLGVTSIPTMFIPGSQYVYGALGAGATAASVNNYIQAKKEGDEQKQNDAIFNGAMAFSTVLPMANSIATKTGLRIAPWVKPMKHKTVFDGMTAEEKASTIDYINSQLSKTTKQPVVADEIVTAIERGRADAIADSMTPSKLEAVKKNNSLIDRLFPYVYRYYVSHDIPFFPKKSKFVTKTPDQIVSTHKFGKIEDHPTWYGVNNQYWDGIPFAVQTTSGKPAIFREWYPKNSVTTVSDRTALKNIPQVSYHETEHELLEHTLLPWKGSETPGRSMSEDIMFWKYQHALKDQYKATGIVPNYSNVDPAKVNYLKYLMTNDGGKFEFPVHMRQIGYALGLKQGQPMPKSIFRVRNADGKMVWNDAGIKEVNNLLGRYEAIDPEHYYSIIPLLDVKNHPDRIWRLLTDTYKLGGKLKYGTNN